MWADELFDPDYYDSTPTRKPCHSKRARRFKYEMEKQPEYFHQPITTYSKKIVNAITGYEYPYRIGSKDELRFYVVMENDPLNYKDPRRLYFDSPEEYEHATGNIVSVASKQRFNANKELFN
jgi:hypothetical protein